MAKVLKYYVNYYCDTMTCICRYNTNYYLTLGHIALHTFSTIIL